MERLVQTLDQKAFTTKGSGTGMRNVVLENVVLEFVAEPDATPADQPKPQPVVRPGVKGIKATKSLKVVGLHSNLAGGKQVLTKGGDKQGTQRKKKFARVNKRVPSKDASGAAKPSARGKVDVAAVRGNLGLSQDELAKITGYAVRSIAGWEAGKPLSPSAWQKFAETRRLLDAIGQLVSPAGAGKWLRTPNPAFEGQTPIQVIARGESDRLWRMIVQIEAGVAT